MLPWLVSGWVQLRWCKLLMGCSVSCSLFQKEHAFDSDVEPHRFSSLPEMSNRSANDLNNLEVIPWYCFCVYVRACLLLERGWFVTIHSYILPHPCKVSKVCLFCFQLKPTLSQLHADLKLYEHHFEWLNKVSKKHHHPALPKLVEMIREMKSLINLLHRQVTSRFDFKKFCHFLRSFLSHYNTYYNLRVD